MLGAFAWSRRVGLGACHAFIYAGEPRRVAKEFLDFFEPSVLATAVFRTTSLKAGFMLRFSFSCHLFYKVDLPPLHDDQYRRQPETTLSLNGALAAPETPPARRL